MDICYIEFENQFTIIKNNQKITITPFLTDEIGNVKIGIDAPRGIAVDREEIYQLKKEKEKAGINIEQINDDYSQKIQSLFKLLLVIPFKSEKLERAAKNLFNREKILTPKSIYKIAHGEISTTGWMVSFAIDVIIQETPTSLKNIFSAKDLFRLWIKPLLKEDIDNKALLSKAKLLSMPELIKQFTDYYDPINSKIR